MPSFDVVCEADMVEIRNAVENAAKEIGNRFDFKGTSAGMELKEQEIILYADADFQLKQVEDVLRNKLAKRKVDARLLQLGTAEKIGGDRLKQVAQVRNGLEKEDAKKIQKIVKESRKKVQVGIQGESVRVSGAKRDDLQAVMALLKEKVTDLPLVFNNFRD